MVILSLQKKIVCIHSIISAKQEENIRMNKCKMQVDRQEEL